MISGSGNKIESLTQFLLQSGAKQNTVNFELESENMARFLSLVKGTGLGRISFPRVGMGQGIIRNYVDESLN